MVDPSSPNWTPTPARDHRPPLSWIHYLPLMIVVVATLIAAAAGVVINRLPAPPAPTSDWRPPAETSDSPADNQGIAACSTDEVDWSESPWVSDDTTAADEVLAAHADELGGGFVEGSDHFATFSDEVSENFSQALGKRLLTTEEVEEWSTYLHSAADALAADGVEFAMVVAAADWSVYDEALPPWAHEVRGPTVLDQLIVSDDSLPIVDTRDALRAAANDDWVYSGINSHWNQFGAMVGFNALAACLNGAGAVATPVIEFVPDSMATLPNESVNEFGIEPSADERWKVPEFDDGWDPIEVTKADGTVVVDSGSTIISILDLPVTTHNAQAPNDATVLLVRDSFGDFMAPYVQQAFATTYQVRHNFDSAAAQQPDLAALAAEVGADLVILQVAERNLVWVPAATS